MRFLQAFIISVLLALTPWHVQAATGDGQITSQVGADTLTIKTAAKYAGAIYSLTFRGKEYIDTTGGGHGRLMQTAFFGQTGACWNPTEAGARDDYLTPDFTTSVLINYATAASFLSTQVNPAFWYHVGQSDPDCPGGAMNLVNVSKHVHSKQVSIGRYGIANLIEYNVQWSIPFNGSGLATYEALTAYMPQDFSVFRTINLTTGELTPVSDGSGEQALPLVFSTADDQHAMGAYCQGLPQSTYPNAGYGRWRFTTTIPPVVKWNAVYRFNAPPKGAQAFRCHVAVGTASEVSAALVAAALRAAP